MTKIYPMYLAGYWKENGHKTTITNPYDDSEVGITFMAQPSDLEAALRAAIEVFPKVAKTPTYERAQWLHDLADALTEEQDTVAEILSKEAGKPISDAKTEVARGIFTLVNAAEEAKRIEGEVIPLDLLPSSKGRLGIVRRFPIGPIAGISPFNFPLNLALHKIAPALASGNSIVLKPPTLAPLTMLYFASLIDRVGVPKGTVSILPMTRETGDAMVEDDRFKLLSFTGSPSVGWKMKAKSGRKKVVLELGGNAGVLVDDDADVDFAVSRIRTGAFSYAGQTCISVQRIFVHESRYDEVKTKLVEASRSLKQGDPLDPATELGPMIEKKHAERAQTWVQDAAEAGADILTGGKAHGAFFEPTVIENAPSDSLVCSEEAFAPLVTLFPVKDFAEGIHRLNDSAYGLQAGVFTNNLERAMTAYEEIVAGGVMVNDIPSYRIDHMPYGGVKDSGLGREGLRYSIEDMTELRLMMINRLQSQKIDV
ncbi:MAG TPA: aldehyde dehydrogenase family protein [Thermomicrobiales bacterium]|nr:aldehyde dehydrogenase family protein [Thermomicrobiales bacterium]